MSYHVAAIYGPPALPPAASASSPGTSGDAAVRTFLPRLVDWALREGDHQGLDRAARLAMVGGHFDALAALARRAPTEGVRLSRDALVVRAGHLVPGEPRPESADPSLLIGTSHGSLDRPGNAERVSAALQAYVQSLSVPAGEHVVVLASFGRAPAQRGPDVVREMNQSLGWGRHATDAERGCEAALWARLDRHLARLRAAGDPRAVADAMQAFWEDVRPARCRLRATLADARGFVGAAILDALRPVIEGLRHATADGHIDLDHAVALVEASIEQARQAVHAHDADLPPLPEAQPVAAEEAGDPVVREARFLPQQRVLPVQESSETFVWHNLNRAMEELKGLIDNPARFVTRLLDLRGLFVHETVFGEPLMRGRPHVRNIMLERIVPTMHETFEAMRDGKMPAEAAYAQLEALISSHREAVLAADAQLTGRG